MLQLPVQARRDFVYLMSAGALYMCSASFTLLLPRYLAHIDATPQQIGWLIGLPVPFYVVCTLLSGWLADRVPVRWLALLGILLSAGSSWAMIFQNDIDAWVWILRALQGVGHAFVLTPIVTMASRSLDMNTRAQGMGYFAVCMQLGNIVGTLVASMLIEGFGYAAYFWVALIAAAAGAIALCGVGRAAEAPLPAALRVAGTTAAPEHFLHGLAIMLALGGAFGMVLQYSPLMLDHFVATRQLDSPLSASWILTTLFAAAIAVRVLAPAAIYRSGGEPWLILCMFGVPVALLLFPTIQGVLGAVVVAGFFGICYGLLLPMAHAFCLNRVGPGRQGWVVSLTNLTYETGYRGFGFVAGPVVGAYGYGGLFMLLAGLTVLGMGIFLMVELKTGRRLNFLSVRAALPPEDATLSKKM